jgi:hypothetical protein
VSHDLTQYLALGRRLKAEGATTEKLLQAFRSSGVDIIGCMRLLTEINGLSLAEAKKVVHFSEAWADLREEHERFHERLEKAAMEVEKELQRK